MSHPGSGAQNRGESSISKYRIPRLAAAGLVVIVAASPATADYSKETMIREALIAAPPSLAKVAAVHDRDGNALREGSSSYVCLPRTPGSDVVNSMCLEKAWMGGAKAWMNKEPVKVDTVGTAYMLAGDGGTAISTPSPRRRLPTTSGSSRART